MHRHAAVHVGGVQGQVVHLQHQLGQREEFDLLGGSALAQEEVKDAKGSNFMMSTTYRGGKGPSSSEPMNSGRVEVFVCPEPETPN